MLAKILSSRRIEGMSHRHLSNTKICLTNCKKNRVVKPTITDSALEPHRLHQPVDLGCCLISYLPCCPFYVNNYCWQEALSFKRGSQLPALHGPSAQQRIAFSQSRTETRLERGGQLTTGAQHLESGAILAPSPNDANAMQLWFYLLYSSCHYSDSSRVIIKQRVRWAGSVRRLSARTHLQANKSCDRQVCLRVLASRSKHQAQIANTSQRSITFQAHPQSK